MATPQWYAARCLFSHSVLSGKARRKHVYEERVVLLRANTDNDAIRQAEREARKYARSGMGISYLGYVETYHLFAASIRSGTEVFSLMRSSNLRAEPFLSRYYDDGSEHRRKWTRSGSRTTGIWTPPVKPERR
jgi:hypothetical protein